MKVMKSVTIAQARKSTNPWKTRKLEWEKENKNVLFLEISVSYIYSSWKMKPTQKLGSQRSACWALHTVYWQVVQAHTVCVSALTIRIQNYADDPRCKRDYISWLDEIRSMWQHEWRMHASLMQDLPKRNWNWMFCEGVAFLHRSTGRGNIQAVSYNELM